MSSSGLIHSLASKKGRFLCVINGVIGHHLQSRKSPLAVRMKLIFRGQPLNLSRKALLAAGLGDSGTICILAHGSCASEKDWRFKDAPETDYGTLLGNDLGISPFFLRYNSGLHISENGKQFSVLLEKLVQNYPVPVSKIILIGHSMGGLVYRSACHYGKKDGKKWVGLVRKIFYLGSPHLGSNFEKLGKLVTSILDKIPNPVTKAIVLLGDLRSDGIKDLRHGYLIEEDWKHHKSDHLFYVHKNKTPLLEEAEHYLICGSILKNPSSKIAQLVGDGVVHIGSGMGKSLLTGTLPFPKQNRRVFARTSHYRLLKSRSVYQQIKSWCAELSLLP